MKSYRAYFFDCDGVILDSNPVKSRAFWEVVRPYGQEAADELLRFHTENGGVSRFKKFHYFFDSILKRKPKEGEVEHCLKLYGEKSREGLLESPLTEGFESFISSLPQTSSKLVLSGGFQKEIQEVFKERGLDQYFDQILGSPKTKSEHLKEQESLLEDAVFFGDSKMDFQVAEEFDLDFVFVSKYTEFLSWKDYFNERPNIRTVSDFKELGRSLGREREALS